MLELILQVLFGSFFCVIFLADQFSQKEKKSGRVLHGYICILNKLKDENVASLPRRIIITCIEGSVHWKLRFGSIVLLPC